MLFVNARETFYIFPVVELLKTNGSWKSEVTNIQGQPETGVIDSWFSILRQKLPSVDSGQRTRVLTSNCWNMIVSPADFSNGTLHELIEKPLDNVGDEDVILFPLLTKAEDETMGNHWTLLKLDLNI
ncbi:hypothetical protein ACS0TY_002579 [Phlomoides rotata]